MNHSVMRMDYSGRHLKARNLHRGESMILGDHRITIGPQVDLLFLVARFDLLRDRTHLLAVLGQAQIITRPLAAITSKGLTQDLQHLVESPPLEPPPGHRKSLEDLSLRDKAIAAP